MTARIAEAHRASRGNYGAPRVHAVLTRGGHRVGRRRVARLMREPGSRAVTADAAGAQRCPIRTRPPDRGCQYTSREFSLPASEFGIRLSVGRTGQCWDNALAESFFATLKNDLGADRRWPSRTAARAAVFEYVESWYNLRRLHSSLGYRSPVEYEAALAA
ncbi:transposase [Embleya sp. NPDC020886]|uniref:transposase n=1 Tax=Embleya sp. NPDC020886 TaxID=3363980 RepID=UPI00379B37EF